MGKLLKYEFIKNRVSLIIFSALLIVSELLFAIGMTIENDDAMGVGFLMLLLLTPVCTLGGLIIGAGTYTKELSNKVGFMVYMTPNSSYKIVASKFVFTAIIEIIFSGLLGLAAYIDFKLLLDKFGVDEDLISAIFEYLDAVGISVSAFLVQVFATFITVLLSLIMVVAIYYIAYTLTATFMQASKFRTFVAAVVFILGDYAVIKISTYLPEIEYSMSKDGMDLVTLVPQFLYSLLIILISYFTCSYMLDKKVSL